MGDRGSFSPSYGKTGGIPVDKRFFSSLGRLGGIQVIQSDNKSNNPTTTYSNTANTTYFAYSKERHVIEHIYYFRGHRLFKSVDFKGNEKPHVHYWNNGAAVGRKSHDKRNTFALIGRDKRLLKLATDFNYEKRDFD